MIKNYLESTFLKTAEDFHGDQDLYGALVDDFVREAVAEKFKLVMVRPDCLTRAREILDLNHSKVLLGTVVDFPAGDSGVQVKLDQALQVIESGADELDFVVDYKSFKAGKVDQVRLEILQCTEFVLAKGKVIKWILETAALSDKEIIQLTTLVKKVVLSSCDERDYNRVFVKTSTGYFKTEEGKENGATIHNLVLILENSGPVAVKASGGIRNQQVALKMIELGVKRLGTSSAKLIAEAVL